MMYSYRIEQAIRAAGVLHAEQSRKGSAPFPYITHLVAVSFILRDYTEDENVIISALLHDTLEDTDYSAEELEADFGKKVREIVEGVTESLKKDKKKYSWAERKDRYLEALRNAPRESLLISAADKIHNMRSIVEEYTGNEKQFVKDFSATPELVVEKYEKLKFFLNENLDSDIMNEFNHVHAEYMHFLKNIEHNDKKIN